MPNKMKAIIVDDEARLRRGIERLVVSSNDWEIIGSFSSGQECIDAYELNPYSFDLLITDVKMPGMDGLTLIKELNQITSFHSMVISGFDDFEFLQRAIREGASDYMIKPIDRDEFKVQLRKLKEKIISQRTELQLLKEMDRKASQLTYVKQIQMLSQLTLKQEVEISQLEWTNDLPKGAYSLFYVSLDKVNKVKAFLKEDWNAWTFAVENITDEMMEHLKNSSIQYWKWRGEDLSYWILLHADEQRKNVLEEIGVVFAEEIRVNIKQFTPLTCSIAVSGYFGDLALLVNIKDELLTLIQFRLLDGGNRVFSRAMLERRNAPKGERDYKDIEKQISKIVLTLDSMDQEKTKYEIASFLKIIDTSKSPAEIEQSLHLLGIQIIHFVMKKTKGNGEFTLFQEVFDLTKKMTNLIDLKNGVHEWVQKVLVILNRKVEKKDFDYIEIAKKWISEHLDQNITIQKIATHVYMNPTYFCEYFKSQTGETVLDYVTRIRMEKAKEMLLMTDYKIYDISVKVGYTDTKYFSRLFKKYYGEVPSKYKERMKFEQI
jgi:two-component system, response regulator YesN